MHTSSRKALYNLTIQRVSLARWCIIIHTRTGRGEKIFYFSFKSEYIFLGYTTPTLKLRQHYLLIPVFPSQSKCTFMLTYAIRWFYWAKDGAVWYTKQKSTMHMPAYTGQKYVDWIPLQIVNTRNISNPHLKLLDPYEVSVGLVGFMQCRL